MRKNINTPWSGLTSTVPATTTGNTPRQAVRSSASISASGNSASTRSWKASSPTTPMATLTSRRGQKRAGANQASADMIAAQAMVGCPAQLKTAGEIGMRTAASMQSVYSLASQMGTVPANGSVSAR